ncbi:MAG: hypothetical protein N2B03_02190, partial [Boseongicola sp.]
MTEITSEITGGTINWRVYQKTTLWKIASIAVQLAGVALLGVLARRTRLKDPLFWPVAILVVSWLSPLSWLYHYLTAFLFLPALLLRFGVAIGSFLVLAVLVPTMYVFRTIHISTFERIDVVVQGTNFSLFLAALSFLVAMKLRRDKT